MNKFNRKAFGLFSLALVTALSMAFTFLSDPWQSMPGDCSDISVGAEGSVFCVAPGSNGIVYKWNEPGFSWMSVGGKADRIAVDSTGRPWVLTGDKKIYRLRGATWQSMPGDAVDIGAGADGSVWVVGDGGKMYKWNDDAFAWEDRGGKANRIAVDAKGIPWVVTDGNKVFRLRGSTWQSMPGDAKDIGAGSDGSVWVTSPGGKVYKWNDDAFAWMDNGGQNVSALAGGPSGDVWVVTSGNKVYWQRGPGGVNK